MRRFFLSVLFFSFLFCQESIGNAYDVELGIVSIIKLDAFGNPKVEESDASINLHDSNPGTYEITIYVYNPEQDIAGFQFALEPKNIFTINKENINGGVTDEASFIKYAGKNGKILGFSMEGNVIPASLEKKVLFKINTVISDIGNYENLQITVDDLVIASKQGTTLTSTFVPFNIENIKN